MMCRKLRADEIECRVGTCNENGCSLLLYKTARTDRAILTEMYGNRWQNDFKVIDGKMYGGIAVYDNELKEWLWRWDCGTESNTEKEKGEASDCFKRAGFKWGIGIELYTTPFIWCNVSTKKNSNGKYQPVSKFFEVQNIGYAENGDITLLIITDDKHNIVYKTGSVIQPKPQTVKKEQKEPEQIIDADIDIISEINSFNDKTSLTKYYNEHKAKVQNKIKFGQAYTARIKEIERKQAQ